MAGRKLYKVELTAEERNKLQSFITKGTEKVSEIRRAQALLKADQAKQGPAWIDRRITEAFGLSHATLYRLRKRYKERGIWGAIRRKRHQISKPWKKLDGEKEAHLISIVQSEPPSGRVRWTLRLLATKMVELEIVEEISYETVRQTLKKTELSLG